MPHVIPPVDSRDDAFFWDGVRDARLLVRKCAQCARIQHPPSPMCPICSSLDWGVEELSGRGTVHSWIVSRHPNLPGDEPRIVALIELAEGIRLVSNLTGIAIERVRNDMPVVVKFAEVDGIALPQFVPSTEVED